MTRSMQKIIFCSVVVGFFWSIPVQCRPSLIAMDSVTKDVALWFTADGPDLSEFPVAFESLDNLSQLQVKELKSKIWQGYKKSALANSLLADIPLPMDLKKEKKLPERHDLVLGTKTMPFYFVGCNIPNKNRPMFIALHGGGSAGGRASSPHAWETNTKEWKTQMLLASMVYPSQAIYFVPRMADDNDGRWYYDYCQDAYDKVIRAAILHHDVDPDRIYLIGISEGAYTAYRMGAFMADRWAGAGSMAGGEPVENAPPENMRNIAFRADIGEYDTMFDRLTLNQRYATALEDLKKNDPTSFVHEINVQAGRGHGIDYAPCPKWLLKYKRNPWPTKVSWKVINVHGRYKPQFYWLALDEKPSFPIMIDAQIVKQKQTVNLTVEKITDDRCIPVDQVSLRVYLNDSLLDLDEPIRVVRNGVEVFNGRVSRSGAVMLKSLAERGDPSYIFPAEVVVKVTSNGM